MGDCTPTAAVVGLEAASRKLREAVHAAVALSEEEQDQVADAMQGVLQQLLLASRLKSLPAGVLSTIARNAGRPARRASRLLSDAYGPLDCGLRLDGPASAQELLALVALNPHRFDHVTSLVLTTHPTSVHPTGHIPALCTALPNLSSLSAAMRIPGAELAAMAPLVPLLTSLVLSHPTVDTPVSPGTAGLLALTGLRSLALPLDAWVVQTVQEDIQALSSLRHLQAMEWLGDEDDSASAALWLPPLGALSGLTGLLIRPAMYSWDQAAVDTLRTGFPGLADLALSLYLESQDDEVGQATQAAIFALATRTALASLQLEVGRFNPTPAQLDLRCLSALQQLSKLSVTADPDDVDQILEVISPATALALLHVEGNHLDVTASRPHSFALAANLKELALALMLFPGGKFPVHVGALAHVTRLALVRVVLDARSGAEAPQVLSVLSNLEVLEMCLTSDFPGIGSGHQVLLRELAGLSRLRDLTLDVDEGRLRDAPRVVLGDVQLWQLLPLCSTLTRLVLGGMQYGTLRNIHGPGLAVVGRLTCLCRLELRRMAVLASPCLDGYLLPLPASLRRLDLHGDEVVPRVQASLQAAARGQDCAVRIGRWV